MNLGQLTTRWMRLLLLMALVCSPLVACSNDDDDDDTIPANDDDITDPNDDDDDGDDDDDDDDDDSEDPITLDLTPGCNPFATSEECLLPFPSSFFQDEDADSPTGVRVNIPQDSLPIEPGEPTIYVEPINTADGCSPAGPILLHFAADIDADQLTGQDELNKSLGGEQPFALFDLETGERLLFMSEMDMNRNEDFPNRYALIIRPMQPMEMGHRHVAVITRDLLDEEGDGFESPPAFAALRDGVITANESIEAIRDDYEEIFDLLETNGYPRDDLFLAWDFMVASEEYLTGSVRSMRETALDEMEGTGLGYTVESNVEYPEPHIARLVKGTFEVPTFLDENNSFVYDEAHHPIRQEGQQSFPYTMVIPDKANTLDEPLPLVVFGHGLFGTGEGSISGGILTVLAEEFGMIMVATDWIGLSGGDLQLIISQVVPNLNRIALVTDRLQQSIINNLTLTELAIGTLSNDPEFQVGTGGELIDESRIYYVGGSLGGIQGSSLVSMSHRFTRGVLAVPGSGWLNMLTRSTNWAAIYAVLNGIYPDPLAQQIGIALIQAMFDLSDPVNLTRHMYKNPLPDAPAERVVLLQEAIGDSQVPNLATEMLARSIGAKLMEPSVYPVPGLEGVSSPTREPALVQILIPDMVATSPPPMSNVPPASDNGVHGAASFLDHVLDQTFHFLLEGEIVNTCDGACDPD